MASLDDFEIWSKYLYRFFDGIDHTDYMSDTANLSAEQINVNGADFLNDKSRLRERIPVEWLIPDYGTIENDVWSPYGDYDPPEEILKTSRCVIKGVGESSGDGIIFSDCADNDLLDEIFDNSYSEKLLVSKWVEPHEYARKIWPNSGNSLRFLVYSPEGEPSKIAACVHKWGTKFSGHLDNWNKGGLTTQVLNGRLLGTMEDFTTIDQRGGNGSLREPTFPEQPNIFGYHPESGIRIMGVEIPFWNEAVEMVLSASEILRDDLPYIGWDVIITDDGPRIIEGNPWPGIQLIQVHCPLFVDLDFKKFMHDHGVEGL
jgi:hypothetical protein